MSDERLVRSILLFAKKHEQVVKSGEAYRYNGELNPKLKKQLDSIIKQAADKSPEHIKREFAL
jgi:hypothetical protein